MNNTIAAVLTLLTVSIIFATILLCTSKTTSIDVTRNTTNVDGKFSELIQGTVGYIENDIDIYVPTKLSEDRIYLFNLSVSARNCSIIMNENEVNILIFENDREVRRLRIIQDKIEDELMDFTPEHEEMKFHQASTTIDDNGKFLIDFGEEGQAMVNLTTNNIVYSDRLSKVVWNDDQYILYYHLHVRIYIYKSFLYMDTESQKHIIINSIPSCMFVGAVYHNNTVFIVYIRNSEIVLRNIANIIAQP